MALVDIIAIALVDNDAIGDLHDASFDTLQLVACACYLDEEEEVDHRVASRLTLSDTHRLDEYLVEASCLTEDNGLASLSSHTTQGTCRRAGANEGVRVLRQFLHTRLVAEDRTLGALARGIDGENGQASALLLQHVDAELIDRGGLASAWHTTDAHTHGVATIGQTLIDHFLRLSLMIGVDTLDEGHCLREDGDIALEDAFYHVGSRKLTTTDAIALQIGVDDGGLLHPTIHLQACIF